MKIAYITSGAANMYCGSCLHDNTLASALLRLGHEALLIPTYTPIRTDEPDVSLHRVFFGGINVYLQQKMALFRHTPWLLDRIFDAPRLLRWVSRFAMKTNADELGELTISMLRGEHGHQCKEIDKLVNWLASEARPQLVNLSNVLISGMVPEIRARLGVPVLGTLQGDDLFLETLPQKVRGEALELVRGHCKEFDGFIATSGYYADFMSDYLKIPRERIEVVYPGLNLTGHDGPKPASNGMPTVGYFARICPEKGLHLLVEAFRILNREETPLPCRLRVSGWLGEANRPYLTHIQEQVKEWGLANQFEHVECPDHRSKVEFLQRLDILSVPTIYREPKGLYVLESLANEVPVVQPRHGSFPELVERTRGGLLVEPEDAQDLARGLRRLMEEPAHRQELGRKGKEAVHAEFTAEVMARRTVDVYERYV